MPTRTLLLACGNSLRADDGIAPWLAHWAECHLFQPSLRILIVPEWHPELALELSHAHTALFLDASELLPPAQTALEHLHQADKNTTFSHHCDTGALLALCLLLYGRAPSEALLLSIGIESTEPGEGFSPTLAAALPRLCASLEDALSSLMHPANTPLLT